MLTICPECNLQLSDKAFICPHCGYPINANAVATRGPNKTKRKRLPNGFGQITELKGCNVRNRFRVMVTVGKTANGKFISKILKPQGYFPTYNDAYAALIEYNRNPYDLDDDISVKELYEKWSDEYFNTLKPSSIRTVTSAWLYCSSIYDMRACDVRARHIKGCMEEGIANIKGIQTTPTAGVKSRIKSMMNLMFDYAVEYEIVDKNYARTFTLSNEIINEQQENKKGHIPFSDEELNKLWDHVKEKKYIDVILIQCYSGWRPQELGLIRLEDVDLDNDMITGGIKTKAGMNRHVPIHPRIKELVTLKYQEALELNSKYLINCTDATTHRSNLAFTYDKYQYRFIKVCEELNLNPQHRAHDGRMHFITMAKKYKVDEYAIKYIVGHAINDITEKVYTKRELDWLKDEIKKIK